MALRQMLSSMLLGVRRRLTGSVSWSWRRLALTCMLRLCVASLASACIPVRVLPPLPLPRLPSPLQPLEAYTPGAHLSAEVGRHPERAAARGL